MSRECLQSNFEGWAVIWYDELAGYKVEFFEAHQAEAAYKKKDSTLGVLVKAETNGDSPSGYFEVMI